MGRITKKPEERKNELMDAALELFFEKGFESTSINDVVKKVGVAQGLFYYYFGSKNDMLDAVLDRYIDDLIKLLEDIVIDKKLNIDKKFQLFLDTFFRYGKNNDKFAKDLHQDENFIVHQKLTDKTINLITPLLVQVIKEGIQKGIFSTPYPDESLEILIPGMIGYIHKYYFCHDSEILSFKIAAIEEIMERMLGAKKGSVKVGMDAVTQ